MPLCSQHHHKAVWATIAALFLTASIASANKLQPLVLITGVNKGNIGQGLAKASLNEPQFQNFKVGITGRDLRKLNEVVASLDASKRTVPLVLKDVSDKAAIQGLNKELEAMGLEARVIFANAGYLGATGPFARHNLDESIATINGHLDQVHWLDKYVLTPVDPESPNKRAPKTLVVTSSIIRESERGGELRIPKYFVATIYAVAKAIQTRRFEVAAAENKYDVVAALGGGATWTNLIRGMLASVGKWRTIYRGVKELPRGLEEIVGAFEPLVDAPESEVSRAVEAIAKQYEMPVSAIRQAFTQLVAEIDKMIEVRKKNLGGDFSTVDSVGAHGVNAALKRTPGHFENWDAMVDNSESPVLPGRLDRVRRPDFRGKQVVVTHHPSEQRRAETIARILGETGANVDLMEVLNATEVVKFPKKTYGVVHVSGASDATQPLKTMDDDVWQDRKHQHIFDPIAVAIGAMRAMNPAALEDVREYTGQKGFLAFVGSDYGFNEAERARRKQKTMWGTASRVLPYALRNEFVEEFGSDMNFFGINGGMPVDQGNVLLYGIHPDLNKAYKIISILE